MHRVARSAYTSISEAGPGLMQDAIYDRDCLMVAAKALSAIVDSEHFQVSSIAVHEILVASARSSGCVCVRYSNLLSITC